MELGKLAKSGKAFNVAITSRSNNLQTMHRAFTSAFKMPVFSEWGAAKFRPNVRFAHENCGSVRRLGNSTNSSGHKTIKNVASRSPRRFTHRAFAV
jgi:hypothetical protein